MIGPTVGSRLEVDGDEIVYFEADDREIWRLEVARILLIAEYTTSAGPADDYFFNFGTICDGEPCITECPVPGGSEQFLEELGALLGTTLKLKLFNRTDFVSRVLWPEHLAGHPLFVQRETARHVGMAKWRRKLFGGRTEWIVSAEVFDAMRADVR